MDNPTIARRLQELARQREAERANLYRARAYRRAALLVAGLDTPLAEVVAASGRRGLTAIPGIGGHIAESIETLVRGEKAATLTERPWLAAS